MIEVVGEGGLLCTTEIGQEAHLIFIEGFILVVQGERGAFFFRERGVFYLVCVLSAAFDVFCAPRANEGGPMGQLLA